MEEVKVITPEELQKRVENGEELHLVDVREDEEVAEGMIPTAKHIRMNDIPTNVDYFDKEKNIFSFAVLDAAVKTYVTTFKNKVIK